MCSTFAALVLILGAGGCRTGSPSGELETHFHEGSLSSKQLSLLLSEHVMLAYELIVSAADSIIHQTEDHEVYRNALRWKINAIPQTVTASVHEDPVFSLFDVWVLQVQMRQFFTEGPGTNLFGAHQAIAVRSASRLEAATEGIAQQALGPNTDFRNFRSLVHQTAEKHPVATLGLERPPIVQEYLDFVKPGGGFLQLASSANEKLAFLGNLMLFETRVMPEMGRWQSELLLADTNSYPAITQPLLPLTNLNRLTETVDSLPAIVVQEREITLADIERQRLDTLERIDRMRQETLLSIRREREAFESFIAERMTNAFAEIGKQRSALIAELSSLAEEQTAPVVPWSKELIDHLMKRLTPWGIGAGVIALIGLGLLWRRTGG